MKTLTGKIVSVKNQATILVEVANHFQHPLYKKYLTRTKKYAVQTEPGASYTLGQTVTIQSCRPFSKTKTFKVATPTPPQTPPTKTATARPKKAKL